MLSQDYYLLEIIISDDFSSDQTIKIVKKIVCNYRGPHTIIINENKINLGLGGHVNLAMKMAKGELVVFGAGDDISDSRRVSLLVEAWDMAGRPSAICSQAVIISSSGELISERYDGYDGRYPFFGETRQKSIARLLKMDHCLLLGCTEAWTPEVFDVFGPLGNAVVHEDNAVSLRAWLLNKIVFLDAPLVKYRTHHKNIAYRVQVVPRSISHFSKRETTYSAKQVVALAHLRQHTIDLRTALSQSLVSNDEYIAFSMLLNQRLRITALKATWWTLPFHKKCMALFFEARFIGFKALMWCFPRLTGLYIFSFGRACMAYVSRRRRSFAEILKYVRVN